MLAADLAALDFCYVTTTGRTTGQSHRIEIWFAAADDARERIYLLAGGRERADWVRNLRAHPAVRVEIGERTFDGTARAIEGEPDAAAARRLVFEKYRTRDDLDAWRDAALPVAIDLRAEHAAVSARRWRTRPSVG